MKNPGVSRYIAMLACMLVGAATGCDAVLESSEFEQLNDTLRVHLERASPDGTIDFFLLPDPSKLSALPQDPLNPLTPEKVNLGRFLFHETALGVRVLQDEGFKQFSCASCHHFEAGFQAGIPQGIGEGGVSYGQNGEARRKHPDYAEIAMSVDPIRTPATLNLGWQSNLGWAGQFGAHGVNEGAPGANKEDVNRLGYEGVESQALAGMDRYRLDVEGILDIPTYDTLFAEAFPEVAETERISNTNAALAIAAYERTLLATQSPFQKWLRGNFLTMDAPELRGAILFFGKAQCHTCHTGPALNSMTFHAFGMRDLEGIGFYGIQGPEAPINQGRKHISSLDADVYKFKTPQLYNLFDSPYYGHGSSFSSIRDILRYKLQSSLQNERVEPGQLQDRPQLPELSRQEVDDLVAFLEESLRDDNLRRYVPESIPSGQCFPNNDAESRQDLGCR